MSYRGNRIAHDATAEREVAPKIFLINAPAAGVPKHEALGFDERPTHGGRSPGRPHV